MKKWSILLGVLVFAGLVVYVFRYAKDAFSHMEHYVTVETDSEIPKTKDEGDVIVLSTEGYDTENPTYYTYRSELYVDLDTVNTAYAGERFYYDEEANRIIYTTSTRVMNCEIGPAYDLKNGRGASGLPTFLFVEDKPEEESSEEESSEFIAGEESSESQEDSSGESMEESEEESVEESLEETAIEPELPENTEPVTGNVYMRAAAVTDLYGVEFLYDKASNVLVLEDATRRYVDVQDTGETQYLKVHPQEGNPFGQMFGFSKGYEVYRELTAGETLIVFGEEEDYYKIADRDGKIGYVKKEAVSGVRYEQAETIQLDTYELPASKKMDLPISVIWQYFSADYGGYLGGDAMEHYTEVVTSDTLKVVAPLFLHIMEDDDGNAYLYDASSQDYIDWMHENGYKVWVTLENVDNYYDDLNEKLTELMKDTERRQTMVQQILEFYKIYGFDGINIDLEGLPEEIGPYFVQFMRELSATVRPEGCVVSVDLNVPTGWNGYYRYDVMGDVCDYICLMAYDEHYANDTTAGSVASYPWVQAGVQDALTEGIPSEKLVLCMPLYTRVWSLTASGMVMPEYTRTISMEEAWDLVNNDWYEEVEWDRTTGQYYAEIIYGDNSKSRVWLEDARSMQLRIDLAKAKELGGVALWYYGWDTTEIWDLIADYEHGE